MRRCAVCVVLAFASAFASPAPAATAFTLELAAPATATYGDALVLRGRITPALVDAPVTIARDGTVIGTAATAADGTFRLRTRAEGPATYTAEAGLLTSQAVVVSVRPRLIVRRVGSGVVRQPLRVEGRVEPAGAGPLRVELWRNGRRATVRTYDGAFRLPLATGRPAVYRVRASVEPGFGWAAAARTVRAAAVHPTLAWGSRGPSVRILEQRLRDLRYALPSVDGYYGRETYEAVLAFQKVNGLPWTGRVDARLWRRLAAATVPRPRHRGDHIEVSKGRQYLLVVRGGEVRLVVHVSTGATGNTPIGRWRIYRKVRGWDWVLWYPMYFLGGFAIHGYPSVPAHPASHGCVRVPMWVAPRLYASHPWGGTVYVYW